MISGESTFVIVQGLHPLIDVFFSLDDVSAFRSSSKSTITGHRLWFFYVAETSDTDYTIVLHHWGEKKSNQNAFSESTHWQV